MMCPWINICLLVWLATVGLAAGKSKRTIYTLFTEPKSWNEAKAICESQFGQLFKAETQSDLDEVSYLNVYEWENDLQEILTSGKLWNGLHKPFAANSTLEYQDCEVKSPDIALVATDPGGECGAFQSAAMQLVLTNCEHAHPFICERFEGDCWYQPFSDVMPSAIVTWDVLSVGTDASACAKECRNRNNSNNECWAFQYDPNGAMGCILYYMSESAAQSNGGTSASVFHVVQSNLVDLADTVLYVRRCFEGVLDSDVYSQFVNGATSPNTICGSTIYQGDASDNEICYCATNEQPPIPEPISDEAKAEEYVKKLSIDTSNTSAAQRKLISAEDNRTSAVSIGYVGVILMVVVFGGLFLLDLNRLIADLKKLVIGETSSEIMEIPEPDYPDMSDSTALPSQSEC